MYRHNQSAFSIKPLLLGKESVRRWKGPPLNPHVTYEPTPYSPFTPSPHHFPHVEIIILLMSHLLKKLCNLKRKICFLNLKTFPEVKKKIKKIRYVFNQFVSLKKQTPHVLEVGSPTYELFRPFCQLLSRIVLHSYSFGIKLPILSCHLICLRIVVLIYINDYT